MEVYLLDSTTKTRKWAKPDYVVILPVGGVPEFMFHGAYTKAAYAKVTKDLQLLDEALQTIGE